MVLYNWSKLQYVMCIDFMKKPNHKIPKNVCLDGLLMVAKKHQSEMLV